MTRAIVSADGFNRSSDWLTMRLRPWKGLHMLELARAISKRRGLLVGIVLLLMIGTAPLTQATPTPTTADGWIDSLSVGYSGETATTGQKMAVASVARTASPNEPSPGTVSIDCSGGATSGNPDNDIYITLTIYVDGSLVASATGFGYSPTAYAHATVASAGYSRPVSCYLDGPFTQQQANDTIAPS